MSDDQGAAEVAALAGAGRYEEAAQLSLALGDLAEAIRLYTRIWNFAAAWPLAERAGDLVLAARLALDARAPEEALRLARAIPAQDLPARVACARTLGNRGLAAEAAGLAEEAGAWDEAVALYKRARDLVGAGTVEERAGRDAAALELYETAARTAGSEPERARADVARGLLLVRLGRRREAIRLLQGAAREPAQRLAAWEALAEPLAAEGYPAAAAEVTARLQAHQPTARASSALLASRSAPTDAGRSPRFRVRRELAAGAAARVVLADDLLLGRPVALKVIQGTLIQAHQREALAAFHREAEAAERLRHPTIVSLLDVDREQGLFVFEWMAGGTLADRLAREQRLSLATARRLALDLLDALDAAHAHGIVHRDVKPPNVFFDEAGNAKLGDFGSAHLMDFGQTQTGGLLGTVAYMAPEQITAGAAVPATDLYALGVVLFEALTGALPFAGADIVSAHLAEAPRAARTLRPGLSLLHEATLQRALAKAPGERFASARDMRTEVRRWPEHEERERHQGLGEARTTEPSADDASGGAGQTPDATPPARPERTSLGRTSLGPLYAEEAAALGLPVWTECREAGDAGASFDVLAARVAPLASSSPFAVQRILDVEAALIRYEVIEGRPHPWPRHPPPELQTAARWSASLRGEPPPFIWRTRGGWVVPCVWLLDGRPPG